MKRKFTLFTVIVSIVFGTNLKAQTTYASISSGLWGQTTPYIWETFSSGSPVGALNSGAAATGVPSGSHNIYVRSGHNVTTGSVPATPGANRNAFNVTIENGASLSAGQSTTVNFRPGTGASGSSGNVATITNNGTFGGPTDGTFVEVGVGASSLTLTGTGTTTLNRLRFLVSNLNPAPVLIIDQNITLTVGNNYALSASGSTVSTADNYTLTVNPGKTVTIPAGYLHNSGVTAGAAGGIGNYTYNINGTIDMSASTATGSSVFAGSTDPTKTTTVNINGTLKLPTNGISSLNLSEAVASGQQGAVIFNINNGGLLDGNLAPINTTTTTIAPRYFRISGTGQLKRTVGAADILFDLGTTSSYNPVTINNAGTSDNFSVNVKNTFDVSVPASKRVDKQWTITEEIVGGSNATVKLSWRTADQTAGFNTASPVFIYHYDGTSWDATLATVTGSGTTADPYVASASGFTSFSPFAVGNSPTLPVSFMSNKAFSKGTGVQVEWTTAMEAGVTGFVVERSADGRNFTQAGTVGINRANTYSWFDATPMAAANYYRIASIEPGSASKFTAIMKVNIGKKGADMVIASNPVKGGLVNLQLSGMDKGAYTLTVFNNAGQQVFAKSIVLEGSSLSQAIQLPTVGKGLYAVKLQSALTTLTRKIIVE